MVLEDSEALFGAPNPLFGSAPSPAPATGLRSNPVWAPDGPAPAGAAGLSPPPPALALLGAAGEASPGSGAAAGAADGALQEEFAFAEVLGAAMHGQLDPAVAVQHYADICRRRAGALREAAAGQLQRAARHMALKEGAEELDAEAATWHLLWFLHGSAAREFPGGKGGSFVEGAGFTKTTRQRVSDLLFQDEQLNRCARTVAWLEFLAAQELDAQQQVPFAATDGVWHETRAKLASGAAARGLRDGGALVTELDPDAPTRQRRRLDPDNAKDEERLLSQVFRLLRAGRLTAARQLCESVGQPWRAASLGGGGAQGPVPVGAAAEEADAMHPLGDQAEDMAAEVDGGAGALRALWRWCCLQAAERAAGAAQATGAGLHEAAVYGALSSSVAHVLPACASWEDAAWAYLRCWLDAAVDVQLAPLAAEAAAAVGADSAAQLGAPLPADALAAGGGGGDAAVAEGLAAVRGGWPPPRVQDALPPAWQDALAAAGASAAGSGGGGAGPAQRFRRVQGSLILDRVEELVCSTLVQWIGQGGAGGGGGGALGSDATSAGAAAEGPAGGGAPPGLMRFGAHLALALWALGIAAVPEGGGSAAAYDRLHGVLHQLLRVYVVHLIDAGTYVDGRAHALVCQRSRFEVEGGPLRRAQAARWLAFSPATHAALLAHANALCREFALGGAGGAAAAWALLSEVLPAALAAGAAAGSGGGAAAAGDEGGAEEDEGINRLQAFLRARQAAAAAARRRGGGEEESGAEEVVDPKAQELHAWSLLLTHETEFASWQQLYLEAVEAERGGGGGSGAFAALAPATAPLLEGMLWLLHSRSLAWLDQGQAPLEAGAPLELVAVVGPEEGAEAPPEVAEGAAFPRFPSAQAAGAAAATLAAALSAAAAAHFPGLRVAAAAGPAPEGMPGLVSVALECGGAAAAEAGVLLLAQAVKGVLPAAGAGGPPLPPLAVVNVDMPAVAVGALCRCVAVPRLALHAAALREALAYMGHEGDEGAELVELAADAQTAPLFSQPELRELLAAEQATAVLQMRNRERRHAAAAAAAQPQAREEGAAPDAGD
eukprot:scaffold2.g7315.t1